MSRRLRYIPEGGALVEVTCRTLHCRFLLRPSPMLNDIVVGVLGRAQRMYPIRVCHHVFASTHFHLLLDVDDALQLARFMRHVNSNLARKIGRLVGWREPLEAAGIDWASVPVGSAPDDGPDTGYRAAVQLLDRAERPTAIICLSDVLAFGVMRAAAERGIRVPQDLSIVGYDDVAEAASAALTTVYQPHAAKGEEAVRLLTEGGDDVLLPTELVVRASSGPAPS